MTLLTKKQLLLVALAIGVIAYIPMWAWGKHIFGAWWLWDAILILLIFGLYNLWKNIRKERAKITAQPDKDAA